MDMTEKTIASEKLFDGRVIRVRRDTVELPNGSTSTREVVEHPGGVAIVPVDADGNVYMVRQYRYPLKRLWSFRQANWSTAKIIENVVSESSARKRGWKQEILSTWVCFVRRPVFVRN